MTYADQVRDYCRRHYVEPARAAGHSEFAIRAGDVHQAMGYSNRIPLVCSAIGAKTFCDVCGIRRTALNGPVNGSNTVFHFAFEPHQSAFGGNDDAGPNVQSIAPDTSGPCKKQRSATNESDANLADQFKLAMFDVYRRAKDEAGYNARIFLGMIADRGGVATAKYLINAVTPSDGYTHLYERGRIDLTVEALVFESARWHPLFTPEEIARAGTRLVQYGYVPKIGR